MSINPRSSNAQTFNLCGVQTHIAFFLVNCVLVQYTYCFLKTRMHCALNELYNLFIAPSRVLGSEGQKAI